MSDDQHDLRRRQIAESAYFRAERRGFQAGAELSDWLEAERDLADEEIGDGGTSTEVPDHASGNAVPRQFHQDAIIQTEEAMASAESLREGIEQTSAARKQIAAPSGKN